MLPIICFAQISDDFSDGEITSNPIWAGNTDEYIVNGSNELQLNGNSTEGGTSYLSTANESFYNASWEFLVKFDFNPSSSNYCNIYLSTNNSDLTAVTQGYFVKIGNTSDEVSLYRHDAGGITEIIDGLDDRIDLATVNLRVKVTRDIDGNWTLMSDTLGGTDYYTEGSILDNTYLSSDYFGIVCTYTSTRWDKFSFDEFIVSGDPYTDVDSPILLSYQVIDNQGIVLFFNENLDPVTALNITNYQLNNGVGNPEVVTFYNAVNSQILLEFASAFISPTEYTLMYENIEDLSSNIIANGLIDFTYMEIEERMIVINEIFADPTPTMGLPDVEYVELYNTTTFSINLKDWEYKIGSSTKTLTEYNLGGGEYLILCDENDVADFEVFGNTLGVTSFPLITNSGQTIVLYDTAANIIDEVTYSDEWYRDSNKEEGGWSLEKIDPNNDCSPHTNWIASNALIGGTPGEINSVYAINNDIDAPVVISVSVSAANELTVKFSEPTDTLESLDLLKYTVSPDFGNPIFAMCDFEDPNAIIIQYAASFVENVNYELLVENISDYCGNSLISQTENFVIFTPEPYELIICEIMADPDPVVMLPEAEYIEIYNSTAYDLDLSEWIISSGSTERELPFCIIMSEDYLVICHEDDVERFEGIDNIIGIDGFPSLTNGGATITLRDKNRNVINTVTYSDDWYQDNFKKNGGYSLEMIDLTNPCQGEGNWLASRDVVGGTPGLENSIVYDNPDVDSPYPIAAEAFASDSLVVYFSEILNESYANDVNNFSVIGYGNPVWISALEPDFSVVIMKFDADFEIGQLYYLEILDSIVDCSGNEVLSNTSIRFAIPDSAINGDIVINELLFNPYSGGSDFIELYNNSDKILDLKLLWLSNIDEAGVIDDAYSITDISRLLLPREHCAISEDIQSLRDNYFIKYPNNIYEIKNLPSMSDDFGTVILTDRYFDTIDIVSYDDDQHYALLADDDGVSLERISYNMSSSDMANWHSAAQSADFATPGYKNSQYANEIISESTIGLSPEVFSPDNDGVDDRLTISYNLDAPGYTATMAIYSANGQFITYLFNNEMLGVQGSVYWDGFDNGNNICPPGIYVLYVEMFSLTGNKIIEKLPIVLSVRAF